MKETPEASLLVAQALLAGVRKRSGDPDAIAFWEQAVADFQAKVETLKPSPSRPLHHGR